MKVLTIALFGAAWNLALAVAFFALGWYVVAAIWTALYAWALPKWWRAVARS